MTILAGGEPNCIEVIIIGLCYYWKFTLPVLIIALISYNWDKIRLHFVGD